MTPRRRLFIPELPPAYTRRESAAPLPTPILITTPGPEQPSSPQRLSHLNPEEAADTALDVEILPEVTEAELERLIHLPVDLTHYLGFLWQNQTPDPDPGPNFYSWTTPANRHILSCLPPISVSLRQQRYKNGRGRSNCAVCLDNIDAADDDGDDDQPGIIVSLPKCDHWFHKECITSWLKRGNNCPVCRRVLDLAGCLYWRKELENEAGGGL